ncbi:MAG: ABC transporter substrate-binding protein [Firmicutes bacterium]|nr:ABC transporter substrate-binding protein [Bacillota bacterium]
MKKFLAISLLAVMFAITACSGDGGTASTGGGTSQAGTASETAAGGDSADNNQGLPDANLTVYFMGATVASDTEVVAAANARLAEMGYNITITPIWGDWAAGTPIQMALDTGDNSVDIVFTSSWAVNYVPNANRGNFVRLDNPDNNLLERFGQDVRAEIPEFLWQGFMTEGTQGHGLYAVPGHKDYAQMYTWDVNAELLDELGFPFDSFDWSYATIFDPRLVEAMEAFLVARPGYYPFQIGPEGFARSLSNSDYDITGLGIFHFGFDPVNPALPERPEVITTLENPDYIRLLETFYDFFNRGFINPSVSIPGEADAANSAAIDSGNYLISSMAYAYGHEEFAQQQRGIDSRFPPMSAPIISTISVQGSGYAISIYSQQQEQAMRFLNAFYTDSELATILTYGVEGLHFERNADGTITLDQDMRSQFAPWRNGTGNIFILPPLDVEGPDFYERFRAYNEAGTPTAFLGFVFDETPVTNEMAALRNVVAEFSPSVTTGSVDPATQVPAYLERLNANGLQRVHDELNRQLAVFFGE